jgi:predicted O-methyltransferase YrrM
MDWIEEIPSAWKGHRQFAQWLVTEMKPECIVELGVDFGYSSFVFANALSRGKGKIYGIDLFQGDPHAGMRNTYDFVMDKIKEHNLETIEIIRGDFKEVSTRWNKPINILHIDGFHTYDAVKSDFIAWAPFVLNDGIILFHDTAVQHFGIKDFFREIGGIKLYFTHSFGLGILTANKELVRKIKQNFTIFDFAEKPF